LQFTSGVFPTIDTEEINIHNKKYFMKKIVTFLFMPSAILFFSACGYCQTWQPLGGVPNGPNGEVLTLYHDTSCLWIAGHFTEVYGMPCQNIIRHTSNGYISTPGFSGDCYKLIKFKNKIYACGNFTVSGSRYALVRFDTTAWTPILAVPNQSHVIYAAAVYKGKLILGGTFTSIGGLANTKLVSYDGATISPLLGLYDIEGPSISSSPIWTMLVDGSDLYVGGSFWDGSLSTAPPYTSGLGKCLVYNGSVWRTRPMNYYPNSMIRSLCMYQGELLASGYIEGALCCPYTSSSTNACSGVASSSLVGWSGWHQIGGGVPLTIRAALECNGLIYAGGISGNLDYPYTNCRLWIWDGVTWSPDQTFVQQGVPTLVAIYAMEKSPDGTRLYVGGRFSVNGAGSVAELSFGVPLPVTLVSFTGSCERNETNLLWSTAMEVNNDHFEIEWSATGADFTVVATYPGKGTTTQTSTYVWNCPAKAGYYRLAQVDYDGARTVHEIIYIPECSASDLQVFTLKEKVVTSFLHIQNAVDYSSFEIISLSGTRIGIVQGTQSSTTIDVAGLPAGLYFVTGTGTDGRRSTEKFFKV
jgi:hypothetical protein